MSSKQSSIIPRSCRHHSASEMTYIVSSGALNSTHSLTADIICLTANNRLL